MSDDPATPNRLAAPQHEHRNGPAAPQRSGPRREHSVLDQLERRYRWPLAFWYPRNHRLRYESEMLAVLMAGARPGQQWPSVHELVDLAANGLRARLRATVTGTRMPAWSDAAAVFGLLAALVLLSQRIVRVLDYQLLPGPALPPSLWLRATGWAIVVATALLGSRLIAASCAWLVTAAETLLLVQYTQTWSGSAAPGMMPLSLSILTATALTIQAPRRQALTVLGVARLTIFAVALIVIHAVFRYQLWLGLPSHDYGKSYVWLGLEASTEIVLYAMLGLVAASGIAAFIVISAPPRPVRRRVQLLLLPVFTVVATIQLGTDGRHIAPVQVAILAVASIVAFALGVTLLNWRESLQPMPRTRDAPQLSGS